VTIEMERKLGEMEVEKAHLESRALETESQLEV
jgi:hypothetical protein